MLDEMGLRSLLPLLVLLAACSSPPGPGDSGSSGGGTGVGGGGTGVGGGGTGVGGGGTGVGGGGTGVGGGGGTGGTLWDGGVPTWRQGLIKWQWLELPGTALSNQPVADPFSASTMVAPTQRINAWNGLSANRDINEVYLACAGGHADWAGNEAYAIAFSAAMPRWRLLRGPTPGNFISLDVPYYSDGRPSSTHLYYALHFVRGRNRIFKMSSGSVWGSGNSNNNKVDGFNLGTNDWDPIGTFADVPGGGGAISRPYAYDSTNDDAYTFAAGQFRKWTAATATWSILAARPSYANDDIVNESPAAVDPTRQRVLFTRNAYRVTQRQGLLLTLGGSLTDATFSGAAAQQAISSQAGMLYLPGEDVFVLKTGTAGQVIRIDPMTFDATIQATTGGPPPDAVNGVYTRWLHLPRAKGIVYLPSGSANFWFLATE
jgi:hypothetical protein